MVEYISKTSQDQDLKRLEIKNFKNPRIIVISAIQKFINGINFGGNIRILNRYCNVDSIRISCD